MITTLIVKLEPETEAELARMKSKLNTERKRFASLRNKGVLGSNKKNIVLNYLVVGLEKNDGTGTDGVGASEAGEQRAPA